MYVRSFPLHDSYIGMDIYIYSNKRKYTDFFLLRSRTGNLCGYIRIRRIAKYARTGAPCAGSRSLGISMVQSSPIPSSRFFVYTYNPWPAEKVFLQKSWFFATFKYSQCCPLVPRHLSPRPQNSFRRDKSNSQIRARVGGSILHVLGCQHRCLPCISALTQVISLLDTYIDIGILNPAS